MHKPGWPITGFEHRDYTEQEIIEVTKHLRNNFRLTPEDKGYLATMIEQLTHRVLQLKARCDILEAECKAKRNG